MTSVMNKSALWLTAETVCTDGHEFLFVSCMLIHRSAKSQTPPKAVNLLWSCEGLWRDLSFVVYRSDCHQTI